MVTLAFHADSSHCERATTTHDCPLSHRYEHVDTTPYAPVSARWASPIPAYEWAEVARGLAGNVAHSPATQLSDRYPTPVRGQYARRGN